MIKFNVPFISGEELGYISQVISDSKFCGGGKFGERAEQLISRGLNGAKVLLTTSCTDALEMAADLVGIDTDSEIIAPSFTFVSTVNPFVMRGARVCFVDVEYPSMNVSPEAIERAITPRTKAVVAVNYAGGCSDLASIREICDRHGIVMIEDAAQSLNSYFNEKPIGTFGHLSAISFHETKNIHCGEGGALVVNEEVFFERAEILREKGTNRSKFFRGEIDKYTWVDIGSSHILSEINAGFLSAQLIKVEEVVRRRLSIWSQYADLCSVLGLPFVDFQNGVQHNGHIFGVFAKDLQHRSLVMDSLKTMGIQTTFHYVPLHSSPMGLKSGYFVGEDLNTSVLSESLIRLPIYPSLSSDDLEVIFSGLRKVSTSW